MAKLTTEEMQARLDCAVRFYAGQGKDDFPIYIELRGVNAWAITDGSFVMNEEGGWEHEPLPSNRTDAFIERTRFGIDEAFKLARAALKETL